MASVVLVAPLHLSGFMEEDVALLRSMGHVVVVTDHRPLSIFRATRALGRRGVVVVWFAAEHAFYAVVAARMHGLRSLIIVGGVEGAEIRLPHVSYGLWTRPWHVRWRASWAMRHASELWAVAPHLASAISDRIGRRPSVVPTVFDSETFRPASRKEGVIFCCASSDSNYRWGKGYWQVREAARSVAVPVTIVGGPDESWPENSLFTGYLERPAYAEALSRARVIVNASVFEGLNNSLCEGMLAGALPVVSKAEGNLHVIEGLPANCYWSYTDTDALVDSINEAYQSWTEEKSTAVRAHILGKFPEARRREALASFLEAA